MKRFASLLQVAGLAAIIAGCGLLAVWFGVLIAGVLAVGFGYLLERGS
jgi:hypothetical protein